MKRSWAAWTLAGLCAFAALSDEAAAKTTSLCDAADSEYYITKASGQLARGAVNLSLCWVELIHQPSLELAPDMGGNWFRGIARGVGHTFLRAAKGVGDVFTAFLPPHENGTYEVIVKDCALGLLDLEPR